MLLTNKTLKDTQYLNRRILKIGVFEHLTFCAMKHYKQTGLISKNTSTLSGESFLKVPVGVVSKSKTTYSYFMPSVVQGFLVTGRVVGVGICSISACTVALNPRPL